MKELKIEEPKELKIEEPKEKGDRVFSGPTKPYKAALDGNWTKMKAYYGKHPERVLEPLTVERDTAFHIAAYSERTDLLRHLLRLVTTTNTLEALSKRNIHGNTVFHEVASTDKVDAAELLIWKLMEANVQEGTNNGNNQTALRELLEDRNELGETPLYRAVALGRTKMAKFLARRIGDIRDHFRRNDEMSILHIAVIGQHFETALWLLGKDKELGKRKGTDDMTCLHLLAKMPSAFKSSTRMNPMKTFIYNRLPAHLHDDDDDDDKGHVEDDSSGSESGMEDLERGQCSKSLRKSKDQHPSAISRVYHAIWKGLAKEWPSIEKMWEMKRRHTSAIKLTQLLVKMDTTWKNSFLVEDKTISLGEGDSLDLSATGKEVEVEDSSSDEGEEEEGEGEGGTKRRPSGAGRDQHSTLDTPLLIAASQGIVEILDEMLKQHPQAIEYLNSNEENLLHLAIAHRQLQIFNHLKGKEVILRCRLVSRIDVKGYTILHHVGDLSKRSGEDIEEAGPALQLQDELKWLERVRKVMPSHYTLHRDNAGRTADELFKTKHANLLNKAQKWIKETTGSSSTVAVLVATVVFAAAYTVPGGTDEKGHPIFLHSRIFSFFTIMDVVSLASSLTSVVMFLSISTSPLEQQYFHKNLPRRLMIGFTLLFFSMITTMLSFTATVLLIIHSQNRAWTSTLIYAAAFLPVSMFALLQFPLYTAFAKTWHYLFKAIKKVLPASLMHLRFFRAVKRNT